MKRSREPEEHISDSTSPATGSFDSSGVSETDAASPPAAKITELDPSSAGTDIKMRCSLPPHKEPLVFQTYDEYESHYHKSHMNRCLECRKNFPSTHLLGVHIEEMHDPLALVKRERGERTYSCFVEGCERKCSTPQKRRMHLIDKHVYPKNFFFAVTRDGIDGRRSLLLEGGHRRRRSSVAAAAAAAAKGQPSKQELPSVENSETAAEQSTVADTASSSGVSKPDVVMDDLAGAMSSLQFVPSSIRFGRGGRKTGFAKHQ
ncbi:hypothetical protein QBC47DRAFT_379045 [Echria macrotheca]|uniref:C2H2-type domain-containing protein n=1 Tax=Echria macrotheca TaxID=438768 RepID=A0AAJ0FA78_9PEZI|nr:hypothetical protein QBC47DRAFT_379045 [Echria macrotheca]